MPEKPTFEAAHDHPQGESEYDIEHDSKSGKKDSHDHGRQGDSTDQHHAHSHGGVFGERSELIFAIMSGVLLLTGWLTDLLLSVNVWVPWSFYVAAYVFGGYYIVWEAIGKILLRRFEIDFLMIVAAIGAAILGAWAEGALLLFLFAIGHALENYAMGRARSAIESLPFAVCRWPQPSDQSDHPPEPLVQPRHGCDSCSRYDFWPANWLCCSLARRLDARSRRQCPATVGLSKQITQE